MRCLIKTQSKARFVSSSQDNAIYFRKDTEILDHTLTRCCVHELSTQIRHSQSQFKLGYKILTALGQRFQNENPREREHVVAAPNKHNGGN